MCLYGAGVHTKGSLLAPDLSVASYNSEAVLHICFYPCAVHKVLGELYRFLSDGSFIGEPSDELFKLT